MKPALRVAVTVAGLLAIWQAVVWLTAVPPFILPPPSLVLARLAADTGLIAHHAGITLVEICLGLLLGGALGAAAALGISATPGLRRWLFPVLVIAPSIPFFALAPLLVLWLGYGIVSKVAMAAIIIFFPVTAAFLDGLRRTDPAWLRLATVMTAGTGRGAAQGSWATLRHIRLPAALPALASGLRVAAAVAPIGAVVGEWVGSSAGLGYLMLHANARMQIDLLFAALFVLAAIGVSLFFAVDKGLRAALPWQADSLPDERT